jgi:Leucine Rich Repeat.
LKILNVSHNHLQDIQALKVLNSLQSITELNISFNEFTTWSIESPMQNLKKLVIDNNKLKTFNLTKTSNLEYVSCVENSIKEIYGLTTLYNLQQLYAD